MALFQTEKQQGALLTQLHTFLRHFLHRLCSVFQWFIKLTLALSTLHRSKSTVYVLTYSYSPSTWISTVLVAKLPPELKSVKTYVLVSVEPFTARNVIDENESVKFALTLPEYSSGIIIIRGFEASLLISDPPASPKEVRKWSPLRSYVQFRVTLWPSTTSNGLWGSDVITGVSIARNKELKISIFRNELDTITYKLRNGTLRFVFLDFSRLNNWYFRSWNLPASRGNRNTKNRNGTRKTIKDIAIFTHKEHTTIPNEYGEVNYCIGWWKHLIQVFASAFAYVNVRNKQACFGHTAVKRLMESNIEPTLVQVNERLPFVWEIW